MADVFDSFKLNSGTMRDSKGNCRDYLSTLFAASHHVNITSSDPLVTGYSGKVFVRIPELILNEIAVRAING